MGAFGGLFIAVGAVLVLVGVTHGTTVASGNILDFQRVHNSGLMQEQTMLFQGGGMLFISGCILLAGGLLKEKLDTFEQRLFKQKLDDENDSTNIVS